MFQLDLMVQKYGHQLEYLKISDEIEGFTSLNCLKMAPNLKYLSFANMLNDNSWTPEWFDSINFNFPKLRSLIFYDEFRPYQLETMSIVVRNMLLSCPKLRSFSYKAQRASFEDGDDDSDDTDSKYSYEYDESDDDLIPLDMYESMTKFAHQHPKRLIKFVYPLSQESLTTVATYLPTNVTICSGLV